MAEKKLVVPHEMASRHRKAWREYNTREKVLSALATKNTAITPAFSQLVTDVSAAALEYDSSYYSLYKFASEKLGIPVECITKITVSAFGNVLTVAFGEDDLPAEPANVGVPATPEQEEVGDDGE